MGCADGQRPAGGSLGGHHPEGLGERARHHHRAARGQQLRQLLVLQATGQQDPLRQRPGRRQIALRGRACKAVQELQQIAQRLFGGATLQHSPGARELPHPLQLAGLQCLEDPFQALPEGPEADHQQACPGLALEHQREGRQQQVGALADDLLADERHQQVLLPHSRKRRAGLPRVAGKGAAGCRRVRLGGALQKAGQDGHVGHRPAVLAGAEAGNVHARRAEPGALGQVGVGDRPPQALARVARAHEHGPGGRQPLAREAEEALRFGLDGVLQRAAVDLDRVGRGLPERPGEDHGPHHEVVGQRQLRGHEGGHLGHRFDVRLQVAAEVRVAQLGEGAGLQPLVAVGNVHRQQAADVGPVDRAAAARAGPRPARGLPQAPGPEHPRVPVCSRVHEPQPLRVALLAEQVDLVSETRERLREARVVDVGPGPAQQVAVEDEDARH